MPKEQPSDVDVWLERETPRVRKALESASRHFDADDDLTVNTLEAVYSQESSFGTMLGTRGSASAAGHFQFMPETAKRYAGQWGCALGGLLHDVGWLPPASEPG